MVRMFLIQSAVMGSSHLPGTLLLLTSYVLSQDKRLDWPCSEFFHQSHTNWLCEIPLCAPSPLGHPNLLERLEGSLLEIALSCFKVALTFWGRRLLHLGGRPYPCSHSLSLCAPPQRPKGHLLCIRIPVTLNPVVETNPPVYCLASWCSHTCLPLSLLKTFWKLLQRISGASTPPKPTCAVKVLGSHPSATTSLEGDRQVAIDTCHIFRDS